ncbi:MAG TPA: hypothetical protein VGL62_06080 [Vicinamibacterales bacterium]|jgi:cytochrome c556
MKFRSLAGVLAGIGLLGAVAAGQARQGGPPNPPATRGGTPRGGTPPGAATPAPRPLVPVAANSLAGNPKAYAGENVTITASVVERLAPTAFTIGQAGMGTPNQTVLVLAPRLTAPVDPSAYVTVIGDAVSFDPAEAAAKMKDTMPALPPEVADKYRGHAAIIATSVINGAMTDLAQKLPPPISADDVALDRIMKQVSPAFNALRQAAAASNGADAATQAAALTAALTDASAFWNAKSHADASQWAADALHESTAIRTAAQNGGWDAVKASLPKLQQACTSCHGQYREREDNGTYRIKQ